MEFCTFSQQIFTRNQSLTIPLWHLGSIGEPKSFFSVTQNAFNRLLQSFDFQLIYLLMPSDKHNSITDMATGLTFSCFSPTGVFWHTTVPKVHASWT